MRRVAHNSLLGHNLLEALDDGGLSAPVGPHDHGQGLVELNRALKEEGEKEDGGQATIDWKEAKLETLTERKGRLVLRQRQTSHLLVWAECANSLNGHF
jgi:hypothetical protein